MGFPCKFVKDRIGQHMAYDGDPFPEMERYLSDGKVVRIRNYPKEYNDQLSVFGYLQYRGRPLTTIRTFVTSADDFFVRNHLKPPMVSEEDWVLKLEGCFEKEAELTLDQIKKFKPVTRIVGIECTGNQRMERDTISNIKALAKHVDILSFGFLVSLLKPARLKWWIKFLSRAGIRAGRMIANGVFTGARLFDVLEKYHLTGDALEIVFEGLDKGREFKKADDREDGIHYARSMPVEKLKEIDPILCYEMNGAPLPHEHGFPLRLILPGIYGHEHVKWLGRIVAVPEKFKGHYQENTYGYRINGEMKPVRDMRPKSVVIRVLKKSGTVTVYGLAWRGPSPIDKVEISVDKHATWQQADIVFREVDNSWLFWKYELPAGLSGLLEITPRAHCQNGDFQPLKPGKYASAYGNNSVFSAVIKI